MDLPCPHGGAIGGNERGLGFHFIGAGILKNLDILPLQFDHCPCDGQERLIYFSNQFDTLSRSSQLTY